MREPHPSKATTFSSTFKTWGEGEGGRENIGKGSREVKAMGASYFGGPSSRPQERDSRFSESLSVDEGPASRGSPALGESA